MITLVLCNLYLLQFSPTNNGQGKSIDAGFYGNFAAPELQRMNLR